MKRKVLLCLAIGTYSLSASALDVGLGSEERVTQLFSYPNNCGVICYNDQTLAETVQHYLSSSLERDGYRNQTVAVEVKGGKVLARYSDGVPDAYGDAVRAFLAAGDKAFAGAEEINRDNKWQYNWQFFLPLGVALDNQKSVELLHFPPDYTLTESQDYLDAKTTIRWAELLVLNGADKQNTDAYQTVIDIAPVAAPASAGKTLHDTYDYFSDYSRTLISEWTQPLQGETDSRPMVVFGSPVRAWLADQYGASLSVLEAAEIKVENDRSVSVLAANHPSYIWYAADPENNDNDPEKAFKKGMEVMAEDVKAACWQAKMSDQPGADGQTILNSCKAYWEPRKEERCELLQTQVYGKNEQEAKKLCQQQLSGIE